jgi:hypothetical protein
MKTLSRASSLVYGPCRLMGDCTSCAELELNCRKSASIGCPSTNWLGARGLGFRTSTRVRPRKVKSPEREDHRGGPEGDRGSESNEGLS